MLRRFKWPLRRKLMLVIFATTFSALLFTAVAMIIYELRNYEQSWVNDLVTQADILARASAPALTFDDPAAAAEDLALLKVRPKILAAALYLPNGSVFATYPSGASPAAFPSAPAPEGYHIDGSEIHVFHRIVENSEVTGTVYLRARYEMRQRLLDYLGILGAVMIGSLVVAALTSAALQSGLTGPILAVTAAAHRVMEQRDFSLRVEKTSEDEIGYLVEAFNAMLTEVGRRSEALEASNLSMQHEMHERLGAEEALRAADRRKDEFLATLAHELRNPLAPLRNALFILQSPASDEAARLQARAVMERQLQQMVRLVDDLLDVSRITTGKLGIRKERVAMADVIHNSLETVDSFVRMQGHALTIDLPTEAVYVSGDSTRLSQVFSNLLNNAAKYTDPGGSISLSVRVEGDQVVVRVSDNGVGIAPEMQRVIFGMFAQADRSLERRQAGLGVGLTLAERLVELHGGSIELHSDGLGSGSEFVVRLPLLEVAAPVPGLAAIDHGAVPTARRILVADDNEDFARSFAFILGAMGNDVRVAHDGAHALATAGEFRPDVAFLDIGLPKLNGYDLARGLRAAPASRHCVLIAVTGWGQEDDRRRAQEAGFDHHLVKPVEPSAIEALLAGIPPRGEQANIPAPLTRWP